MDPTAEDRVCDVLRGPGGVMFICSRREEPVMCACGAEATKLCDHPVDSGTCDRAICDACATEAGSVLRMHPVAFVRAAARSRLRGIDGERSKALFPDTVDYCAEHARSEVTP